MTQSPGPEAEKNEPTNENIGLMAATALLFGDQALQAVVSLVKTHPTEVAGTGLSEVAVVETALAAAVYLANRAFLTDPEQALEATLKTFRVSEHLVRGLEENLVASPTLLESLPFYAWVQQTKREQGAPN